MHPIGGWPSDPGHRALPPFSKPAATLSLPLASTTRGRHSQTDNEHDPSPIIESIRALTPAASTTAADGRPRRASGWTSAQGAAGRIRRRRSSSASARHAVVSATTRSPCSSNSRSRSAGSYGREGAGPRGPLLERAGRLSTPRASTGRHDPVRLLPTGVVRCKKDLRHAWRWAPSTTGTDLRPGSPPLAQDRLQQGRGDRL
jgi:hypothetical protein